MGFVESATLSPNGTTGVEWAHMESSQPPQMFILCVVPVAVCILQRYLLLLLRLDA